jgi:hypothetical protein
VAVADLGRYVIPRLERRLTNAYHAYQVGTFIYREHGEPRA